MDIAIGGTMAGPARTLPAIPDLPPAFPAMDSLGGAAIRPRVTGGGPAKSRQARLGRVFCRRDIRGREKGGAAVGKTKRGKGTKLMAVEDGVGFPLAAHTAPANPHEITLVQGVREERFTEDAPQKLIGDRAYDSDRLDRELAEQGIELISPHRYNRSKPATQDGRALRRYQRRWKVERLFAWSRCADATPPR